MEKEAVLARTVELLLSKDNVAAEQVLNSNYPFVLPKKQERSFTEKQKLMIYFRDGFIDRYSGKRLVNPGLLKCLSVYFPSTFPYHPHGKMSACHIAYWELFPTVDHVSPVAREGEDTEENIVTTSMLNNSIKSNWTLQELNWTLRSPGNIAQWDGLTSQLIKLVEGNAKLLQDFYIRRWFSLSKEIMGNQSAQTGDFYCPMYKGLISQYDCDELCCIVDHHWRPNDGLPPLIKSESIYSRHSLCENCNRRYSEGKS